jgi:hypothetical protein
MKPNNYASKSLKIFRGTGRSVETEVNIWLAAHDVIIRWMTQSETEHEISLTIFYTQRTEISDEINA